MAVALEGVYTQNLGTSFPLTPTTSLPLNDDSLLLMIIVSDAAAEFDLTGSDSLTQTGATWQSLWASASQTGSLMGTSVLYAEGISGAADDISLSSVKFGTGNGTILIAEFSGVSVFDVESHQDYDNIALALNSGNITPSAAGNLLVGFVTHHRNDADFSPTSAGYSSVGNAVGPGFGDGEAWVYWRTAPSTAAQSFEGDITGTVTETFSGIISFGEAATPPTPLPSSVATAVTLSSVMTALNPGAGTPADVDVAVALQSRLRVRSTAPITQKGILEATLDAIGEEDAEIGGQRFTRLVAAVSQGDTVFFVENANSWPTSGKVAVNSIVYRYSSRTAQSLIGITYIEGGTINGARQDHRIQSIVLDISGEFSAIDQVRRALFVNTAEGEDLSVVGRNLGVERLPFLSSDEQFRNVIKALAYNPKGTVYGLELALDAIVGAGNYEISERLITDPNTVFIKLLGAVAISDFAQGKTFLSARTARLAVNSTSVPLLEAPIAVGGVKWKDEALNTDMRAALPSTQSIVEYEGDAGTLQWAFEGGDEGSNASAGGEYTSLVCVVLGGAAYEHIARLQPESNAQFDWLVSLSAGGTTDPLEAQAFIRDTNANIAVGFEVPGAAGNIEIGFIGVAGNFLDGSTTLSNTGSPYRNITIKKEGTSVARLLVDGVEVQVLDYASFDPSVDHKVGFGNYKAATSAFEIRTKEVWVNAQTLTDYWAGRGSTADVAATQALDVNETFFLETDIGKQVRITGGVTANPQGGLNNGTFEIASFVDVEQVTLDGKLQIDGVVTAPDQFAAPDAIFTYPDDLGKAVVITGSGVANDGTYVITSLLEEGTLNTLDDLQNSGAKTRIAVMSGAGFTSEGNLNFRVRPVFVAESNLTWEMSDAGSVSGAIVSLRQPLPITTPGYDRVLDVLAIYVLSAHLQGPDDENVLIDEGPPAEFEFWPVYLADPLGFISQYIEAITAAGVIPEFEVE